LLTCALASSSARSFNAEVRWTQYGVPHVRADSFGGLGYGFGYAIARDAMCELNDRTLTLRGIRSGRFGTDAKATVGFVPTSNINSDLFYRVMLPDGAVRAAYLQLSVDARNLADGYAAGFNRQVRDRVGAGGAAACASGTILPMLPSDVVRAMMQIGTLWKANDIASAAAASTWENLSGSADAAPAAPRAAAARVESPAMASNAWAFGSDVTGGGAAMVLANPHTFWQPHWLTMHQIHLTVPNVMDVMGADFLGLPVPVAGFTRNLAWTIEAPSTVSYYVLLAMKVEQGKHPSYELDGRARKVTVRRVDVQIRAPDGSVSTKAFHVPYTKWGPIYHLEAEPDRPAGWYAIADAGEGNARGIDQLLAAAQAVNVKEFEHAVATHRGITAHLVVGDRFGEAGYIESGPLLDIEDDALRRCAAAPAGEGRFDILDGSRSVCAVRAADGRPRLAREDRLPAFETRGIVYNMNDSYHRSLFQRELGGYSLLLGDPSQPPGPRKLMAQRNLGEALADGRVTEAEALDMMFSDRNYSAETTLDGILDACRGAGAQSDAARACGVLAGWDRRNDSESQGALLFHQAWPRLEKIPGFYAQSFAAGDPFKARTVSASPTATAAILDELTQAQTSLQKAGLRGDEKWGAILARPTLQGRVPLHGGDSKEGVLNSMTGIKLQSNGFADVVIGTSYAYLVTWKSGQLAAQVLLAHGQSLDPASPHYADQLSLFDQKRLVPAKFSESEIAADPELEVLSLRE
jgi:acyl-homoserine-lactone acylase